MTPILWRLLILTASLVAVSLSSPGQGITDDKLMEDSYKIVANADAHGRTLRALQNRAESFDYNDARVSSLVRFIYKRLKLMESELAGYVGRLQSLLETRLRTYEWKKVLYSPDEPKLVESIVTKEDKYKRSLDRVKSMLKKVINKFSCGDGWVRAHNNSCYFLSPHFMSGTSSAGFCRRMKGKLYESSVKKDIKLRRRISKGLLRLKNRAVWISNSRQCERMKDQRLCAQKKCVRKIFARNKTMVDSCHSRSLALCQRRDHLPAVAVTLVRVGG